MLGIISFGAYIPVLRINRDDIARAWGRNSLGGERSVANNDEDTVTMSVEAAFDCLKEVNRNEVDGVFFASTTPPYIEKQSACLLATVVDLKDEIMTVDFANSLRSGTNAIKMAYCLVKSGEARNVLLTASDCRLGYPRSDFEQSFGDGAGALLVGEGKAIATIEGSYSIANEMMDVWRNPEDTFVQTWERRWVLEEGYAPLIQRVVSGVLRKCDLEPKDIKKIVLPAPDLRTHQRITKKIGFEEFQVQDPLIGTVGDCGTAQPLLMLVNAFEEAQPGDIILLAAYGDGADAFIFRVTEEIRNISQRRGVRGCIASKMIIPSYERYLSYRGLIETAPGEPFRLLPSATATWRDRDPILRCYGSRCRQCGTLTYPPQRICNSCRSKDNFEKVRLSDRTGRVFNYSLDNLAGRSDDPTVIQTIVELDGEDTRFYCMMTDCDPSEVKLGMPVEFAFRRLYEGAGFHNYFWKCRQIRGGGK